MELFIPVSTLPQRPTRESLKDESHRRETRGYESEGLWDDYAMLVRGHRWREVRGNSGESTEISFTVNVALVRGPALLGDGYPKEDFSFSSSEGLVDGW